MRLTSVLTTITLALLLLSCGGKKNSEKNIFSLTINSKNKAFKPGDTLSFSLNNPENKEISNISYAIGNVPVEPKNNKIILSDAYLGIQNLTAKVNYEGQEESINHTVEIYAAKGPKLYKYTIINEYPHDHEAYTQGLEFHNDTLYEGTGLRGKSTLRKVDYKTGEVLKKIDLPKNLFGEGITILNNKIYQLTWQSKQGFVYNLDTFEKISSFTYTDSKEGWGLCNDGEVLFKSDGTDKIWILNPETVAEEKHMQLVTNKSTLSKANELEYVDGIIYANTYLKDGIIMVDAKSGATLGIIDCRDLKDKITSKNKDVLNGIAYNPTTKTFFITGKNWEKMFEVTFEPK